MKYLVFISLLIAPLAFALDIQQLKSHGGALIANVTPNYAFEHMSDATGDFMFLKKEIGRNGNRPLWEVVDHLSLGQIDSKDTLYYAMCNYRGKFEPKIVAIAEYEADKEVNAKVKNAWIADIEHGGFVSVPVNDVECFNEGFAV
ncbi:hypothetical protein [Shewanella sp.]|uniref:hypothetical protein n=1 Tax=Shewanella sp. TaxID=50422 RepID=UPI003A9810A4